MLPPDGRELASSIEKMLAEDIPACDKELSVKLFASTISPDELLAAWEFLDSVHRAAYKHWSSRK